MVQFSHCAILSDAPQQAALLCAGTPPAIDDPRWQHRGVVTDGDHVWMVPSDRPVAQLTVADLPIVDAQSTYGATTSGIAFVQFATDPATVVWTCAVDSTRPLPAALATATAVPVRSLFTAADSGLVSAIARAVGQVTTVRRQLFHPRTGEELRWDGTGSVAVTAAGVGYYPRINPAVIGLVFHPDGNHILLAKHARRASYFSTIAGFVEQGETVEQAFVREVAEEVGLVIGSPQYLGSQPWPMTNSLMLAMRARAVTTGPMHFADGEIAAAQWVSRDMLRDAVLPIAAPGSVARTMIDGFQDGTITAPAVD
ncbi:NAD(+) diphosphatase [Corynebacterium choanae]|uniref:NAD(+) diphosphatase n=1 Tax=Corynebacterium choanae TaxID=1862358 RepID=A0A3G6J4C1_9CORY|nr:NAD(+) diphosphatase [Corynebacterium choanae]AZA12941.1 NADH pyrophosphatase [Corynebacterium choanae]